MIRIPKVLRSNLLALLLSGSVMAQIPDFAEIGEIEPHGITSDGTNLWVSDYEADKLFKLDAGGKVVQTVNLPFGSARGIAWHNGNVLVAKKTDIRLVDPATGNQVGTLPSPDTTDPDHQGLAIGDGKLWIVSGGADDRIYGVNPTTGALIIDFPAPGTSSRGIFYHNGSLWNLDSSSDLLYKLSPTDGAVQDSYPIPLGNPRGLIHHDGNFLQVDLSYRMLSRVDITNDYSTKAISQSQYSMPSGLYLPYTSSHPIDQANSGIKRILFYQHGVDDNAPEYFARGLFAARQANKESETLVITLQLLDDSKFAGPPLPANQIYWTGGRFWGGQSASSTAQNPRSDRHSSYEILDHMLGAMTTNTSLFPNLEQIVISGHSGGGQFANRYAVSSPFQTTLAGTRPKVDMKYIVMNPSSYVYLNPKRVDTATLDIADGVINFDTPTSPPDFYDEYGYGLDDLYTYQSAVGKATMLAQYPGRKVVYLMGDQDTGTSNLDISDIAMLQGENRYKRAQIYYAHLRDHYGDAALPRHRFVSVPGVGHSGFGMITSPNGLLHHFEDRMKLNINPTGSSSMQLAWTGGEGAADVESSTNLVDWTPLSTGATSPYEDTGIDMATTPKQFYRLREAAGP